LGPALAIHKVFIQLTLGMQAHSDYLGKFHISSCRMWIWIKKISSVQVKWGLQKFILNLFQIGTRN